MTNHFYGYLHGLLHRVVLAEGLSQQQMRRPGLLLTHYGSHRRLLGLCWFQWPFSYDHAILSGCHQVSTDTQAARQCEY